MTWGTTNGRLVELLCHGCSHGLCTTEHLSTRSRSALGFSPNAFNRPRPAIQGIMSSLRCLNSHTLQGGNPSRGTNSAHVVQCRDSALKTRTVSVQIRPWARVAVRKDPRVAQQAEASRSNREGCRCKSCHADQPSPKATAWQAQLRPVELELGEPFLECQPVKRAGPRC